MFDALTRAVLRWPRLIVIGTLVLVGLGVVVSADVTDRLKTGGYTPASADSAVAGEVMESEFPFGRPNLVLEVRSQQGVDSSSAAAVGEDVTRRLRSEPGVDGVISYWETGSQALRSRNGEAALVVAHLTGEERVTQDRAAELTPRFEGTQDGVEVLVGGPAAVGAEMETTARHDIERAELIGIPIIALMLMIVFRSVIASFLPLIVGIVGVIGTNVVLRGLTEVTDVSIFALNLATGLSLGLAVDYALFIVRRHREELRRGADVATAIRTTMRTAGRTVAFSAMTVVVSMSAMLLFPMYFLRSFAYAGISVVILAALAALIPLPAALVALGDRVNALDLGKLARRALGRPSVEAPHDITSPGWRRLTEAVMRRPVVVTLATTAFLLVLATPVLGLSFGIPDDRSLPESARTHQVQEHLRQDFEARPTAAVIVVAQDVDPASERSAIADYAARISALPHVTRVESSAGVFAQGDRVLGAADGQRYATADATYLSVATPVEEISAEGKDLVRAIRELPAPFPTLVGGTAAELLDTQNSLASRLGPAIGVISVSTVVLLFLLSGSVLVPLKALAMNFLSLGATFGALVWIFQHGHLSGLLGFEPTGWVAVQLLVLLFCVAFGVSMDYEVFLLARIKEEYDRRRQNRAAVVYGMERTGGLVTAAAVITSIVFTVMGTAHVTHIKMFGIGLALAVVLDAVVVRTLLVPALMRLAGDANWWAPRPLRRVYDRFGIHEGAAGPDIPSPRSPAGHARPHGYGAGARPAPGLGREDGMDRRRELGRHRQDRPRRGHAVPQGQYAGRHRARPAAEQEHPVPTLR